MSEETDDQGYVRDLLKPGVTQAERDWDGLAALGIVPEQPPHPDAALDWDGGAREPANASIDPVAEHDQAISEFAMRLRQERLGA